MTFWYYFANDGQKKGPLSGAQLRGLAKQGTITPGTLIENEDGKSVPAKEVKGLTFAATVPPPLPPVEANPFTAAPPAEENPFVDTPTKVSPFRDTVPEVPPTKEKRQNIVVPVQRDWTSIWINVIGFLLIATVAGIVGKMIYDNEKKKAASKKPVDVPLVAQQLGKKPEDSSTNERHPFPGQNDSPKPQEAEVATNAMPIPLDDDSVYYFNTTYISARSESRSVYIDNNDGVYSLERNSAKIVDKVRSIYRTTGYASSDTYFFIKTNNELWAMGDNQDGQVGDDTGLMRTEPVFVMKDAANLYFERGYDTWPTVIYALKTDKSRWMWGGRRRREDKIIYAPVKTDNYFNHNQQLLAEHISMENGNPEIYTMAKLPGDIIRQLGGKDNVTTSIEIEFFERSENFGIYKGPKNPEKSRYYAITKDGSLWGWGYNGGKLGDGTRADKAKPVKLAENAKRLLPDYFVTQSNDWYVYSDNVEPAFTPKIHLQNVLFAYSLGSVSEWYTADGKLLRGTSQSAYSYSGKVTDFHVDVIIDNIKLPSIVRASDGHVIVPRPEQIVQRAPVRAAADRVQPAPPRQQPAVGEPVQVPARGNERRNQEIEDDAALAPFTPAERTRITRFTTRHGKDVRATDRESKTLLHKATENNEDIAVVKYLVSEGANVKAKDKDGNTPLHWAALKDANVEVLEFLVTEGANVDAANQYGNTPLHAAAVGNNVTVAKFLVGKGASVNIRNNTRDTPLDVARKQRNTAVIQYLAGIR